MTRDLIWNEDAQKLAGILGRDNIRAVGGCVRDALLGRALQDVDFATVLTPHKVMEMLREENIVVKPTGLDHGTVTAILNGKPYEITTLRKDVATDGRRAVVNYTTDWAEDAQRRDFTINALYMDVAGEIYDGSLQGLADLDAGKLSFIGDARMRIREDFLRIMRLFRFVSQLKGFLPDEDALKAAEDEWDGLKKLSAERITSEWDKLLAGDQADSALSLLIKAGKGRIFALNGQAAERFKLLKSIPTASIALRYALAFDTPLPASFRFSRERQRQFALLRILMANPMGWQETVFRHDRQTAVDLYIGRAILAGKAPEKPVLQDIMTYKPPECPVEAETYIREGYQGAALGEKLRQEREKWIAATFIS